jgi:hypothetical protein
MSTFIFGCPPWARTKIDGFKVRSLTIRGRGSEVDPRDGFEPPLSESESDVLPLNDRGMVGQ